MAKEQRQMRIDRVQHAAKVMMLAIQAIMDQGASEAEILLVRAIVNHEIDFLLLTQRMVIATIEGDPEGGPKH